MTVQLGRHTAGACGDGGAIAQIMVAGPGSMTWTGVSLTVELVSSSVEGKQGIQVTAAAASCSSSLRSA